MRYKSYIGVFIINTIIVVIANVLFLIVLKSYNSTYSTLAQLGLGVFKLIWSAYCLPGLLGTEKKLSRALSERQMNNTIEKESMSRNIVIETICNVFNNVIVPCIAVSLVSPDCFYNVIVASTNIVENTPITFCASYDLNSQNNRFCAIQTTISIELSYTPGFNYSYQCSSAILKTYTGVFMNMFIVDSFVSKVIAQILELMVKFVKRHVGIFHTTNTNSDVSENNATDNNNNINITPQKQLVFNSTRLLIKLMTNISILSTFGALYPPLAIMICFSMYTFTQTLQNEILAQYEQSFNNMNSLEIFGTRNRRKTIDDGYNVKEIKRIKYSSTKRQTLPKTRIVNTYLAQRFKGIAELVRHLMWGVFPLSCSFYAFFLVDILGNSVGYRRALWAPLLMLSVPFIMYIVQYLHKMYLTHVLHANYLAG